MSTLWRTTNKYKCPKIRLLIFNRVRAIWREHYSATKYARHIQNSKMGAVVWIWTMVKTLNFPTDIKYDQTTGGWFFGIRKLCCPRPRLHNLTGSTREICKWQWHASRCNQPTYFRKCSVAEPQADIMRQIVLVGLPVYSSHVIRNIVFWEN